MTNKPNDRAIVIAGVILAIICGVIMVLGIMENEGACVGQAAAYGKCVP